ncbi:RimJ/RimL family protein N-acetyltransferase [Lacrimispora xylanisolvens]|uniref:RimJ/RimL family protein N-acetyltransferase n=1 Tax=Lacrimispora xylanisolvens TaxID=384636 RepID=A0A2S6HUH6_9FIRM|nr:GNAT family N-acetyltransferase [Hungatella xylanolytica]PPK81495.1 RimJ/RimL family protein N-acetyltransferase [Hungatella xylanolytica]
MREIITDRLVIRKFTEHDGEDLYEYFSNPKVLEFEPYKPYSREKSYSEAKRRADDQRFLAVCLKNGKLIGNFYFAKEEFETWEVGYVFNDQYWGKGYATEGLLALMKYGFHELGVRRMIAMCDPQNPHSWKLLERVGMRREGTLLKNVYFFTDEDGNPIWKDTYEYGILKSEFQL